MTRKVQSRSASCQELEAKVIELQNQESYNEGTETSHEEAMEALQEQVYELEKDRDFKEPLVQLGAAVRVRNLERAKGPALGTARDTLNKTNIAEGNAAAHNGNGKAEAALFSLDDLDVNVSRLEEVYQSLYHREPSMFESSFRSKMQRIVDLQVTAKLLKDVIPEGTQQFNMADAVIARLFTKWEEDNLTFETGNFIDSELELLEAIVRLMISARNRGN